MYSVKVFCALAAVARVLGVTTAKQPPYLCGDTDFVFVLDASVYISDPWARTAQLDAVRTIISNYNFSDGGQVGLAVFGTRFGHYAFDLRNNYGAINNDIKNVQNALTNAANAGNTSMSDIFDQVADYYCNVFGTKLAKRRKDGYERVILVAIFSGDTDVNDINRANPDDLTNCSDYLYLVRFMVAVDKGNAAMFKLAWPSNAVFNMTNGGVNTSYELGSLIETFGCDMD